jgi:hypothetical protein
MWHNSQKAESQNKNNTKQAYLMKINFQLKFNDVELVPLKRGTQNYIS